MRAALSGCDGRTVPSTTATEPTEDSGPATTVEIVNGDSPARSSRIRSVASIPLGPAAGWRKTSIVPLQPSPRPHTASSSAPVS